MAAASSERATRKTARSTRTTSSHFRKPNTSDAQQRFSEKAQIPKFTGASEAVSSRRQTLPRTSKAVAEKKLVSDTKNVKRLRSESIKVPLPSKAKKTPVAAKTLESGAEKAIVSKVPSKTAPSKKAKNPKTLNYPNQSSVEDSRRLLVDAERLSLSDVDDDEEKAGTDESIGETTRATADTTKSTEMDADSGFHGQSSVSASALSDNSLNDSNASDALAGMRFPRRNAARQKFVYQKADDEESVDDSDADPHFKASSDDDFDDSEGDVEEGLSEPDSDIPGSRERLKKADRKFVPKQFALLSSATAKKKSSGPKKNPLSTTGKKAPKMKAPQKRTEKNGSADDSFIDDSDSDGWEAVEELGSNDEGPSTSHPVEVTISVPTGAKKKQMSMETFLLNRLKRRQREMRVDAHKVHLLCSLGHGFFLNDIVGRNPELLAVALSLWENSVVQNKSLLKTLDPLRVKTLVGNIKSHFPVVPEFSESPPNTVRALRRTLMLKRCPSYLHLTMVMLLMLRSLGVEVRLIFSMQPLSVKEAKLPKTSAKKQKTKVSPYFQKIKESVSGKGSGTKAATPNKKKRAISSDEDSDFERKPKKKTKKAVPKKDAPSTPKKESQISVEAEKQVDAGATTSIISPKKSNNNFVPKRGAGVDYWLDVYCPKSKVYVPVHCILGDVNRFEECERDASQPIQYVVAFGEENSAKDVTAVFCQNWLTVNRKLQVDVEWWKETMAVFKPKDKKRDEEEDEKIKDMLLARPRPKTVQEFKGHPLYIVPRHLLKYEAIYPPNPVPVDHVKDEPVYLRDVVHLLHTRENWLKEARLIKIGEKPYKEVKKIQRRVKRRKRDDPTADLLDAIAEKEKPKEQMAPLYGYWQTMDYVNPVAKNGKVPRNEYGNVDMFQPSMLPIGCVHIPIKNIHRVAKQLDIDCAAAMTGWSFGGGHCHPIMDGWIVCEEFADTLMDAWNNEQDKIIAEEKSKKSQRATDNWRKLMRGLHWKKKLQFKYGINPEDVDQKTMKKLQTVQVDSDEE